VADDLVDENDSNDVQDTETKDDAPAAEEAMVLTPVIKEYWDLKQQYPDFLLFYQIGDFFELYFEGTLLPSLL
jgi:hypothetical protein